MRPCQPSQSKTSHRLRPSPIEAEGEMAGAIGIIVETGEVEVEVKIGEAGSRGLEGEHKRVKFGARHCLRPP